jgi:signal transduction histidine kinase
VRVTACLAASECELVIEDTGPGIPEDELPRIFIPFYRGSKNTAPGTGIGLATVERIVRAHGGRIVTESQLGKGTRFRIFLPLAKAPDHDLHSAPVVHH